MSQINSKIPAKSVAQIAPLAKTSISRQNSQVENEKNSANMLKSNPVLERSKTYLIKPNDNLIANKAEPKPISKTATKPLETNENKEPVTKITSLSEFKMKKRAEINKTKSGSAKADGAASNTRNIETIIFKGRQNGMINLNDFALTKIPSLIWNKNITEKPADLSMDDNDFRWWDQVEIQKLILASNKIKIVPTDIKALTALTTLDIHDNQLESVDEAIGELNILQNLNLSHNQLVALPNNICELRRLITLNLSHNKLQTVPKNFGQIDDLEDLDLSNNCVQILPKSLGWFCKLRRINLQANQLKSIIPEIFNSTNLKIVDLCENQIDELPIEIGELAHIEQLYVRQNRITSLPNLKKCCKLKDWDVSFNKITEIDDSCFDNLVSLVNFNLRDNQLNNLPKTIKNLQVLERLDLSNNNLSNLPCELAAIESLKQILLVGNPLRTIRKDIISRGSDAVIKHLKNQLVQDPNTSAQDLEENMLRSDIIKSTKIFDLSGKKLTNINSQMISYCKQSTALVLNVSKNQLQDLPDELELLSGQLNELNLSMNLFTFIPRAVLKFTNLSILDLRGNQYKEIPYEICTLKSLRELIIANNKLTEIPAGVYELPILEILFANNNNIKTFDPFKIIGMKFLSTLNLQNNDIMQLPIELGKAEQIKSLQLEGNPFRCPRPQILAKGTIAILDFLRGRLSVN